MDNVIDLARSLRRPKLLVRAARFGLADYDRERGLKRVFGTGSAPGPGRAVASLIQREAEYEETRRAGRADYSPARHVEVLIALMAEVRFVPQVVQNR